MDGWMNGPIHLFTTLPCVLLRPDSFFVCFYFSSYIYPCDLHFFFKEASPLSEARLWSFVQINVLVFCERKYKFSSRC